MILLPTGDGWKRLTADLQIEDVPGIDPVGRLVLATYDPGQGDMLVGTSEGLYSMSEQGVARFVPQTGKGAVRVLQHLSAVDALILGSEYGLFRERDDHTIVAIPLGDAISIGTVYRAVDVPWARLTLIAAARGIYVLDKDEKLTRLLYRGNWRLFALPAVFRISLDAGRVHARQRHQMGDNWRDL